jgi:L-fuculose-phosphate aldolase
MDQMTNSLRADLDELARACRVLELEGQGDRVVGHMALRDPDDRGFWMKRAGISLGEVFDARDFVLLDWDGKQIGGDGKSHGEWPIHSEIMKARPEINATSHTHPFYASVYSASNVPLSTIVPRSTTQPVRPPRWEDSADLIGTVEMASSMVAAMKGQSAVLLRNHGIVTCGASIADPVLIAIALEKMCRDGHQRIGPRFLLSGGGRPYEKTRKRRSTGSRHHRRRRAMALLQPKTRPRRSIGRSRLHQRARPGRRLMSDRNYRALRRSSGMLGSPSCCVAASLLAK